MIFPTLRLKLWSQNGTDIYGQPQLKRRPDILVSPVKIEFQTQHSTVRTDSSGSHGAADEVPANIVFLVRLGVDIGLDDVVEIHGSKARVIEKRIRYTAAGVLDHYEIRCEAWK